MSGILEEFLLKLFSSTSTRKVEVSSNITEKLQDQSCWLLHICYIMYIQMSSLEYYLHYHVEDEVTNTNMNEPEIMKQ